MHTLEPATRADPFPPVNPANFTADSPSVANVESYLHAMLGYDPNRIWRVLAIQRTAVAGLSRVSVALTQRAPNAPMQRTTFYVLPDGKHLIATDASGLNPFGPEPFAANRAMLKARADGPARGAASKDLMLVEFGDLQCPRCKEAQATMARLQTDFPKARVVYQSLPLTEIHPYALAAATYGACVRKKGDAAFFAYAQAVYDTQAQLTADAYVATLKAAVIKAGGDADVVAACAETEAAKNEVAASTRLAADLGVEQTPALVVNGRVLPLAGVSYDLLKNVIAFQAASDGVVGATPPSGLTLPPRQ